MGGSYSKQWVLLAAGSKGWENYRHQADVCHAYQVARKNGIPEEQIVVMMYDDIADNKENHVKGKIFNEPDGPNVYTGVQKDYTGKEVSAENFLAVLRGDSEAVKKTGRKKSYKVVKMILSSFTYQTMEVMVSFAFLIPHFMHMTLLRQYIQCQRAANFQRFYHGTFEFWILIGQKMALYLEACHSGSMLKELKDHNVYAVAACRPDEKSHACFKDKKINAWLSDVFTAFWLQHTKTVKLNTTSLGDQFDYLKKKVTEAVRKPQTLCNYGDMGACSGQPTNFRVSDVVDATEVPLLIQENRIKNEQNLIKRQALERQYHDLKRKRKTVDEALQKIAERTNASRALTENREVTRTYELKLVAEHFRKNLFNWEEEQFVVTPSHIQVLVNLCECGLQVERITEAITRVSFEIAF